MNLVSLLPSKELPDTLGPVPARDSAPATLVAVGPHHVPQHQRVAVHLPAALVQRQGLTLTATLRTLLYPEALSRFARPGQLPLLARGGHTGEAGLVVETAQNSDHLCRSKLLCECPLLRAAHPLLLDIADPNSESLDPEPVLNRALIPQRAQREDILQEGGALCIGDTVTGRLLQQLALRTPSLGAVLVTLTSRLLPLPPILTLTTDLSCQAVPQS